MKKTGEKSRLVMVDGSDEEIRRAETILNHRGIQDWGIFDATDSNSANYPAGTAYPEGTRYGDTPQTGTYDPSVHPSGTLYPDNRGQI